ncbi:MAG TPA: hypothetical protein DCE42_18765 [Myxococcales bacterium]|nr:hypothetical protein [Deltaproteobacteria bacterium]MBK07356.1 hypothetical protein [Deltaproteobacteria bacterium]MBU53519.1 hypothetical protein [Deltaproteobacteria bacterium]HAA56816.1 hypothetical protein [Myxococcales bacterium]
MAQCTYCGSSRSIEQDHVRAQSKGGVTTVPACRVCNRMKGDKSLSEFIRWVKRNDPYRAQRMREHNKGKRGKIAQTIRNNLN